MKPLIALILCVLVMSARAQSVYRCGNLYSASACPQASLVDANDARSESQRAEARLLAANDTRLGDQMEQERRKREAVRPPAVKPRSKPAKRVHATKIRWFKP